MFLVALIFLITPLCIAVPARADVLTGSVDSITLVVDDPPFPYLTGFPVSVSDVLLNSSYFLFSPRNDQVVLVPNGVSSVSDDSSLGSFKVNVPFNSPVFYFDVHDGFFSYDRTYVNVLPFSFYVDYVVGFGDFGDLVVSSSGSLIFNRSAGVLSVFSGIGSWLSGAVQNISTMFWTAESGMSVLGYLAVASLAVAVILLIFYLIAGWLKFR